MVSMGKRARRAVMGVLVLGLLASCGGGTEQITPFEPTRYIAFGDEMSVLTKQAPLGRKYTVNAVGSDGVSPDCAANTSTQPSLLWTQVLGNTFGFVFAECNPANLGVTAFSYAAPGAKADDFAALTANNGPNVIVSTIPLMSVTPYALRQAIARPGINAVNVLNQFSNAFNTALRTHIPNDGTRWGLVELDALLNAAVNNPNSYGLVNITQAVCTADLPDCENVAADLKPNGNAYTWLWASDRWIAWQAHARLGNFARSRARDNPFGCG